MMAQATFMHSIVQKNLLMVHMYALSSLNRNWLWSSVCLMVELQLITIRMRLISRQL